MFICGIFEVVFLVDNLQVRFVCLFCYTFEIVWAMLERLGSLLAGLTTCLFVVFLRFYFLQVPIHMFVLLYF